MDKETIGNRIETLIKEQNISQKKFAQSIKADATHINKIIKGKSNPSDSLIYLICEKYNVKFDWLKQGVGEIHSSENSILNNEALEIFDSLDNGFQELALFQLNQLLEFQKKIKFKNLKFQTQEKNSNLSDISHLSLDIKDILKIVESKCNKSVEEVEENTEN